MSLLRRAPAALAALAVLALCLPPSRSQNATTGAACPLNFTVLSDLITPSSRSSLDVSTECGYILQGLRLVRSRYLQLTGSFLPPLNSSESCWDSYQTLIDSFIPNFDIRRSCGFETSWIAQGSPCAVCTTSLSSIVSYLNGSSVGNVSDCTVYPWIYAAAFANYLGPTDLGTAKCLFSLDFTDSGGNNRKKVAVILVVLIGCGLGVVVVFIGFWFFRRKHGRLKRRRRPTDGGERGLGLQNFEESTTLVRFSFEDIKKATRNFSRDYIIGRGGYGNVYRGSLQDGTEVALKRFKNCSAAGDANFAHEVEVIASVRHVNLVALRGYCIATTQFEGHQRIIVCDLMSNGSLHDHLFGSTERKLSWPTRQRVALGTARGLAYLHYGAQPGIIHRDIKASNILLDDKFEAKVADFGLAKFTAEGMTHMSTRVAGTMGYVAPEYALYGQLTERSDVYSFGVVLLELLSGKKALSGNNDGQPSLITDWAWSLVREGRPLDVIEDNMPETGSPEVMEQYVLVAVLCSHPQLYARPTMDQVVKMLETELSVPSIPERPIPLVADMDDIERSFSSMGSGQLSTPRGFQPYTLGSECASDNIGSSSSTSK
ncbi:Protein kinase domain-containing protein [Psidium guajava]|nr:Protein kinase domain-containing protein [Psidium guajava]